MIDRSLILLTRLRWGARLRKLRRGLATKRGIAFTVLGGMLFMLWLLPAVFAGATGQARHDPAAVRENAPLIMLGLTLVMAFLSGGNIITFSAAEIDHLFAGPYSRHQLVLYKIAVTATATIGVALMVSFWQWRSASIWIAGFIGIWLAWLFAQSLAMLIVLARPAITARRSSPLIRLAFAALLVLILAAVFEICRPLLNGDWDFSALLRQARNSRAARIVLAPFDVLTATITAERIWPDLIQWAAASCGMIAVLIGLILRLDAYFIESSLAASERVHSKVQRFRRSGGGLAATAKPVQSLRLPMLPRMGGIGPVLWRQMTIALRGAKGLLLILALVAFGVGPIIWGMSRREQSPQMLAIPALVAGGVWLVIALPSILRFDFRSDLAHIDALKLLPLRPSVVVIGQMLTPVLMISLLAWVLCAVVVIVVPHESYRMGLAIGAVMVPPLVGLVIGLENATFLLFPTAQKMATPGDITMIGRNMVTMFVKMLALMLTLAIIGGVGASAYALSRSWPITIITGWVFLTSATLAMVPIVARLFARFDPSMDSPSE